MKTDSAHFCGQLLFCPRWRCLRARNPTSAGGWLGDSRDKWPWLDHSPQKVGLDAQGNPEQISVSIAQHPTTTIGRSYKNGTEPPVDIHNTLQMGQGLYFDEQWKRALEVSPQFVFVTG